jgi:hypothetical protein
MLLERYNHNFQLVEAYLLSYDKQFQVMSHMLYSNAIEIPTSIKDSTFMPFDGDGVFSTSFPGMVDSIVFHLRNVRQRLDERGSFQWESQNLETIKFSDSIYAVAVDLKNQLERVDKTKAIHHFAKGLGRVITETEDKSSVLVLRKILTEEEWKYIITK